MSLTAEEISNNWSELLKVIETEFSGDRREKLLNLYKEYYPENAPIMKKLAETSPETRKLLMAKSVGDLLIEKPENG